MKKRVTLYNILFPIWLLWLLPFTWIFPLVLIANFLIDSLVIYLSMRYMNVGSRKENYKKSIIRIWLSGFAADVIGIIPMLFLMLFSESELYDWIGYYVCYNPLQTPQSAVFTSLCILLAGICIFQFNRRWALNKTSLSAGQKRQAALIMAFTTAPYLYLLPLFPNM